MKKRILAAGLGIGLAVAGAGFLTACGPEATPTPDGISISTYFDTTYYVGEKLDVSGGILDYTKDGKTTQVTITNNMITGFSSETVGDKEMIITYEGEILILRYKVKSIPELPLSFEKSYRSQNYSIYTRYDYPNYAEYDFIRFEKQDDKVYCRVIHNAFSRSMDYDPSYDSKYWNEGQNVYGPFLFNYQFNTKTENWEFDDILIFNYGHLRKEYIFKKFTDQKIFIEVKEISDGDIKYSNLEMSLFN